MSKDREEFIKLAKLRKRQGRLIEAAIFYAEVGNDRSNWKPKPRPKLGKIKKLS